MIRTGTRIRKQSFTPLPGRPALQAKLRIGGADTAFEREADTVAREVMRMPEPNVQRKCAACEEEESLQRKATGPGASVGFAPPIVQNVVSGGGSPLDPSVRSFMEPRFGHDFSNVRIHTGSRAAASAGSIEARAYTAGRNIVFNEGEYQPGTHAGRELIAHELTHVLQQGSDLVRRSKEAAKKCPTTETIPDDVHKAVDEAWKKSGHGGATVTEHGGRIVNDSTGKRQIRTGSGGGGSISLPAEKPGDTTTGTFHTHPYSSSEGSTLGVSFSGGDVNNFINGGQGSVKYVGAGTCIFIIKTLDKAKQDACKAHDIKKRWNDTFAAASGTFQEKVHAAVKAAIAGCGICYYKACRPNATSPIPKTANEVA